MEDISIAWSRKSICGPASPQRVYIITLTNFYRPLDSLALFATSTSKSTIAIPARYAVRQVLDQEFQKYRLRQAAEARQARFGTGAALNPHTHVEAVPDGKKVFATDRAAQSRSRVGKPAGVKRDFFGRIIATDSLAHGEQGQGEAKNTKKSGLEANRIWVSYHEGFSNAVRKPITLAELMRGM